MRHEDCQTLREELAKYPDDALCYAYEGEVIGIGIMERMGSMKQLGFIIASEKEIEE